MAFDRTGYAKIAGNLSLRAYGHGRTLLSYEARTRAPDEAARRAFLRYSSQELKDLLVRAEFAEVTLFGDLGGSRYGPHADRPIASGGRPRERPGMEDSHAGGRTGRADHGRGG